MPTFGTATIVDKSWTQSTDIGTEQLPATEGGNLP